MALLTRGRAKQPPSVDDSRMSVIDHLEALRRALIIAIIAWVLATVVAWFFSDTVFNLLVHRAGLKHVVILSPTGGFSLRFKLSIYMGVIASSPIVFWQLWWFVSPGLHAHEKRFILPLIAATTFFFLLGVAFAGFALPLIINVLLRFVPSSAEFLPQASDLLGFVLGLVIAFGIVFELPVILWTLGMLRIISSRWLYAHRAYWVIGLGLLANVMTPGADPFTPLIVFVPLYVFWEGTTLLLKLSGR